MIDLVPIEGFDWDADNSLKNAERHSGTEPRFHALGRTDDGRRLHIAFTLRAEGRLIRVISARDMHRKERTRYAQDP